MISYSISIWIWNYDSAPFPHTKAYDDLMEAGRIFDTDWDHTMQDRLSISHKNMTPNVCMNFRYAWKTFYKDETQEEKMFKLFTKVLLKEMEDGI